jgi:hypothetical protein
MININPFYKGQAQARRPAGKLVTPERLAAVKASYAVPRVRVEPTRPDLRAVLKHPNGMRFRSEGSVEWPLDRFTSRRLRDGDIRIVEAEPETQATHGRGPATHHRSTGKAE